MQNALTGNWRTTALGFLVGVLTYAQGVGGKLPSTRQDWIVFGTSALMAGLGVAAKDSAVGSQAKEK